MNSGRDETTALSDDFLAPPAAPIAMPEQAIVRRRRVLRFFSLRAFRLLLAR